MVDTIAGPIASGAITGDGAATRVAQAPTPPAILVAQPSAPPTPNPTDVAQTSGLARDMAAAPPVDVDRVATIRKAIADGRFPILPATIADRLIALKLQWNPNEPDSARHDALVRVIDALHAEISALKSNDVVGLERATAAKLAGIDQVAGLGTGPVGAELRALAEEANRLNETCRIYVNLMAANVRRRLQTLTGDAGGGVSGPVARAYA